MSLRTTLIVGLVALGAVLAVASMASLTLAERTAPEVSEPPELDHETLRQRGFALFAAKGCTACHRHREALNHGYPAPSIAGLAPDLTDLPERFSPGPGALNYLRSWLKNPRAIKPDTEMPKLGLNDDEIDGLLRFLLTEEHFALDTPD